jgi:hypothetical protein
MLLEYSSISLSSEHGALIWSTGVLNFSAESSNPRSVAMKRVASNQQRGCNTLLQGDLRLRRRIDQCIWTNPTQGAEFGDKMWNLYETTKAVLV